jgi:TPR repeat protein
MYQDGLGVAKDDAQAVSWYRKAADQGFAAAQSNLGLMYLAGRGVQHDDGVGAAWLLKAAQQGEATAQHNIGFLFDNGRGLPRDAERALAWYRKAAENGSVEARSLLQARNDSDNATLRSLAVLGLLGIGIMALSSGSPDGKDKKHSSSRKSEYEYEMERIDREHRTQCNAAQWSGDRMMQSLIPGCY